jgi:predicted Zn-dependent protease with MMP-like domain
VTVAEVEAAIDMTIEALPAPIRDMVDITIHVARDRQDLPVIKAAIKEAGLESVAIPQDFRGMYLGEYLEDVDDDDDDREPIAGVMVLNAAMLRRDEDVLFTVLHELGHALGYDEDEITALGLE